MKKIILISLIFIFTFFSFSFVWAVSRDIGAGLISECVSVGSGTAGVTLYNCKCQKSGESSFNDVKNCGVGWLISDPICACCGDCTLDNFLGLFINYANNLLKYFAVTALLFFVIGGIIWITSGGSSERVQKGKKIITGSIIGLVIILFAFTIVNIVMKALKTEEFLPDKGLDWVACPSPGSSPPYETLKDTPWCYDCNWTGANIGCQGSNVKNYQSQLNKWGCNCGIEDGIFGPDTESCTRNFQTANNGLSVDGMVGPNTYEAYIRHMLVNAFKVCH